MNVLSQRFKIVMSGDAFPVKGLHSASLGSNVINNSASAIFFYRVRTSLRDVSLRAERQSRLWANSALSSSGHVSPGGTRKRDSIARTVSAPRTWAIITPHALRRTRRNADVPPPFWSLCHNFPSRTSPWPYPCSRRESLSLLLAAHLRVRLVQGATHFFPRMIHCREVKKNEGLK